jgi:hypothetical protein
VPFIFLFSSILFEFTALPAALHKRERRYRIEFKEEEELGSCLDGYLVVACLLLLPSRGVSALLDRYLFYYRYQEIAWIPAADANQRLFFFSND